MTKISASILRPIGSTAICQKASISMRTTNTSYDRSKTATATTSSSHRFGSSQSIHQHPNYQNAILLLLPILIMILKETSALPPIIKIGEFVVFPFFFSILGYGVSYTICICLAFVDCWTKFDGKRSSWIHKRDWLIKPFDNNRPPVINMASFQHIHIRTQSVKSNDHSKHSFTCLFSLWE